LAGFGILHNDVGQSIGGDVIDVAEEDLVTPINVNVKGMALACKYAIPHIRSRGWLDC